MIIDYSTSRPPVSILNAAGITSVGRYIGWDSVPGYPSMGKNITSAEANELISNGISVFLAFEYNPNAAAMGATQGAADGKLAAKQLGALGAPPGMGVYFAVDYDIPDYAPTLGDTPQNAFTKLGPVAKYFQAINELKNPYQIGVYGGYWAVKRVLDAGLATLAWQTVAWSGGNLDSRSGIYQIAATAPVIGADIDIREHNTSLIDFGQWPRPSVTKPKDPSSKEQGMIIIQVSAPAKHAWTGTRTFLYSTGSVPQHIVSSQDQANFSKVLPTVAVTWDQFTALGGQ